MQPEAGAARPHVRRIIKLGGAAITDKARLETLQGDALRASCAHVAACARWAARGCDTVVVHGAGSFGHMQASEYGVARGGDLLADQRLRRGFSLTRASVARRNHLVVAELAGAGLPACGISPCGAWATCGGEVRGWRSPWRGRRRVVHGAWHGGKRGAGARRGPAAPAAGTSSRRAPGEAVGQTAS
jgi:hypothetical protein